MKEQSSSRSRRKYDSTFKEEVLKMATNGRPVKEISESLGISEYLIYRWKKQAKNGLKQGKDGASSHSTFSDENEQLRKRLKEVELERDILKKALGIFSRNG